MLSWSIRLFRLFGIQLAVHTTFFLLVGYVAWAGWHEAEAQHVAGIYGALISCAYLAIFFTCVVLHELGHALMARRFGVGVPRILLLPIGGMAEFDSIPRRPSSEISIALAGPAVNFAIIALLLLFVPFPGAEIRVLLEWFVSSRDSELTVEMGILQQLLTMNLIMGCFNLVPVFPMDGGRVLRALLATRLPYLSATFYAATVGKILSALGALGAFWQGNPQLAVLFAFIFLAGEIEYRAVRRREREDERWRRVMAQIAARPSEVPPYPNV